MAKNTQPKIKVKKGLTLIELIVAISIFAMMVTVASGVFVNAIRGYKRTKATQKNLEAVNQAMSTMAKTLRTSSVKNVSSTEIIAFDNSQVLCLKYTFDSTSLKISKSADTQVVCLTGSPIWGTAETIAQNVNSGAFATTVSSPTVVGKVTISMEIASGDDTAKAQTTVSLRDYQEVGW